MFTGIVDGIGKIISIQKKKDHYTHVVKLSSILSLDLNLGASVSHNGCCLTVTAINCPYFSFDIIKETLKVTNLKTLSIGDYVNIERSVKYGDEIGGHIVSGHVISIASICHISKSNNNYVVWMQVKKSSLMQYIFVKGFICIDGISLTVGEIFKSKFCVYLIPETLLITTIGTKRVGDLVNIEVDCYTKIIVDTTKRLLKNSMRPSNER